MRLVRHLDQLILEIAVRDERPAGAAPPGTLFDEPFSVFARQISLDYDDGTDPLHDIR